jgi:hypothetical protein
MDNELKYGLQRLLAAMPEGVTCAGLTWKKSGSIYSVSVSWQPASSGGTQIWCSVVPESPVQAA